MSNEARKIITESFQKALRGLADGPAQGRPGCIDDLMKLAREYLEFSGADGGGPILARVEALEAEWEKMRTDLSNLKNRVELEKIARSK